MAAHLWHYQESTALAELRGIKLALDCKAVDGGIRVDGPHTVAELCQQVLAVRVSPPLADDARMCDRYRAGNALVVSFTDSRQTQLDLRWSLTADALHDAVRIELVGSLHTQLPRVEAVISVFSTVQAEKVWLIGPNGAVDYQPADATVQNQLQQLTGILCSFGPVAFLQFAHPSDCCQLNVADRMHDSGQQPASRLPSRLLLEHVLLGHPLEKGVIVRARMLGMIFQHGVDANLAAKICKQFAESEMPLSI